MRSWLMRGVVAGLVAAAGISAVAEPEPPELPEVPDRIWLRIDPRSCEDPFGGSGPEAVRAYYAKQGVEIADVKIVQWDEPVCKACWVCPAGYSVYVWVKKEDQLKADFSMPATLDVGSGPGQR